MDLKGKTALVTGAASGIGAACARRYAEAGALVICTDIVDDAGQQVADEIGGRYHHLDVSDSSAWSELATELAQDPAHLDLVHLNAGIMLGLSDISEMTDDDYLRIVGINQHGAVFGLRATVPLLEAAGGGHALITGSMASFSPLPVDLGYSMSKHAIAALVRSASPNLAERGINLNAVARPRWEPGSSATTGTASKPRVWSSWMPSRWPMRPWQSSIRASPASASPCSRADSPSPSNSPPPPAPTTGRAASQP